MPSFTLEKKCTMRRVVSSMVFSLPRLSTSMRVPSFSRGSRKWIASIYPVVGKLSSNISTRRISSVRMSLRRMNSAEVQKASSITLELA